jgi:hypothetical protein
VEADLEEPLEGVGAGRVLVRGAGGRTLGARAQAKADELRAEVELAAVAMRAEGATLEEIGTILGISRMGVLKMMRRHEQ